ncbi:MAG: hypothetical protein LBT30_00205 [Clostridiales bacterium]|jgi:predicted RNA-binding Zn-ribbon protein involved in translation (DUF1610 family)|nr:hypothetical protein [Clostridiales bacterium]
MEAKKFTCATCGAQLSVSKSGNTAECPYCLNVYVVDDAEKLKNVTKEKTNASGTNEAALLKKAKLQIENGDFDGAKITCDKVSDINAECAELWIYYLLIRYKKKNLKEFTIRKKIQLANGTYSRLCELYVILDDKEYKNAIKFANAAQIEELESVANQIQLIEEENNKIIEEIRIAEENAVKEKTIAEENAAKSEREKAELAAKKLKTYELRRNISGLPYCIPCLTFLIALIIFFTRLNGFDGSDLSDLSFSLLTMLISIIAAVVLLIIATVKRHKYHDLKRRTLIWIINIVIWIINIAIIFRTYFSQ